MFRTNKNFYRGFLPTAWCDAMFRALMMSAIYLSWTVSAYGQGCLVEMVGWSTDGPKIEDFVLADDFDLNDFDFCDTDIRYSDAVDLDFGETDGGFDVEVIPMRLGSHSSSNSGNANKLYVRGGGGDGNVFSVDFERRISPNFGISLRYFQLEGEVEKEGEYYTTHSYYYYTYSYYSWYSWWSGYHYYRIPHLHYYSYRQYHTYHYTITQKAKGEDLLLTWYPFGESAFSPYVSGGLRNVSSEASSSSWRADVDDPDDGIAFVLKVGLAISMGCITLRGEYIKGDSESELIGDIGFSLGDSFELHGFVEQLDLEVTDRTVVYGGGVALSF